MTAEYQVTKSSAQTGAGWETLGNPFSGRDQILCIQISRKKICYRWESRISVKYVEHQADRQIKAVIQGRQKVMQEIKIIFTWFSYCLWYLHNCNSTDTAY